ncbi:MAG: hypothetical protein K0R24_2198 [Gammaproteobacteria bacterium]|nr:hypothetical protein [Gammaproteobacteria bacterium]
MIRQIIDIVDKHLGALVNLAVGTVLVPLQIIWAFIVGVCFVPYFPLKMMREAIRENPQYTIQDLTLEIFMLIPMIGFFLACPTFLFALLITIAITSPASILAIAVSLSLVNVFNIAIFPNLGGGGDRLRLSKLFTFSSWAENFWLKSFLKSVNPWIEAENIPGPLNFAASGLLENLKALKESPASKEYVEAMLTPEELEEFKQAIDAEPDASTKKHNQSLYDRISNTCAITTNDLLNTDDPPITVITTIETRESTTTTHGTFSYSGFLGLLEHNRNGNIALRHPLNSSAIMNSENTTISFGFHEVDFDYIRGEIKKWKERIAAGPAEIESKEEEVSQATAVHGVGLTTSTAVVSAPEPEPDTRIVATPPSSPRLRDLSLDGLRAARVAYFNFPQENGRMNSNRIATPSTSPSFT